MRKRIFRGAAGIVDVFMMISAMLLLATTILSTLNAIVRFSGLGSVVWAEEIGTLCMVIMVFLSQPNLEFRNRQLCIGVLQSSLKNEKIKRFFHILRGIITMSISGCLMYQTYIIMEKAEQFHYSTPVLQIPRVYLYGMIALAFLMVFIAWAVTIFANGGRIYENAVDLGVVDESVIDAQLSDSSAAGAKPPADANEEEGDGQNG